MSAVVTVTEVTISGEKVKINEINEIEREIMICFWKYFHWQMITLQ